MMGESGAIAQISRARQFLAEAKDLSDIKAVRDMAEAARLYARAAGLGQDAMNEAAEIKLRAERMAGDALALRDRPPTGPAPKLDSRAESNSRPPTLDELGITLKQSMNWQAEASVPEPVFEQHVADTKAAGEPLTTAGVVRLARADSPAETRQRTLVRAVEDAEHILREPDNERALYALSRLKLWVRLHPSDVAEAAADPEQDAPAYEELAGWVGQVAAGIRARASGLRTVR